MKVNDSFFIKGAKIGSLSQLAAKTGKIRKQQFTCRSVNGGVRVWRIK